jgi:hypothetical protein
MNWHTLTDVWWFGYVGVLALVAFMAMVFGDSWWKRGLNFVALILFVLVVFLSGWRDTGQPPETARHTDPPRHWWKVPPD